MGFKLVQQRRKFVVLGAHLTGQFVELDDEAGQAAFQALAELGLELGNALVSPAAAWSLSSGAVIGAFPAIPMAPQYPATGLTNA